MARKKKTIINESITAEQAGQLLGRYADLTSTVKKITGEMEQELNEVREEYRPRLEGVQEEHQHIFDRLENFAKINPDLFVGKKSIELVHGKLGFRKSTHKVKPLRGFAFKSVVELLKVHKLKKYIRLKEEVDREKLIADREEETVMNKARTCGFQIIQDETFYVEPKEEAVLV